MQTHPNFKSFVPLVNDANTMDDYVGHALCYQYMFQRKTPPWEMALWQEEELQSFEIDLRCVDRLYFIGCSGQCVDGSTFFLLARVAYKDREVFVEMNAECDYSGFDCQGGGEIFVSTNANLLSKVISSPRYDMGLLYRALKEDGYDVSEEADNCYRCPVSAWHNPPMLRFLSHLAISNHKERLQHYKQVLPKALVDSVSEFINIRDAIREYDS